MTKRAVWVCGLCGALAGGCSNGSSASPDGGSAGPAAGPDGGGVTGSSPEGSTGTATGPDAGSLAGTWTLTLGPMGSTGGPITTVTIGQDSLHVTSPAFTLTATRTGNVLTFTDNQSPGVDGGNFAVLTATQTAGPFNGGILPFDLGGSWTMQAGPRGASPTLTCTLTVSATEIDGACQNWFSFTSHKTSPAASSLGDFGGTWANTWTWQTPDGGVAFPCELDFTGNSIRTCDGGAVNGQVTGSPLAGITFTYDGANTVSGAAQGWAEYAATR
jgi:hypothetical protein